jgi:hypothetical protein
MKTIILISVLVFSFGHAGWASSAVNNMKDTCELTPEKVGVKPLIDSLKADTAIVKSIEIVIGILKSEHENASEYYYKTDSLNQLDIDEYTRKIRNSNLKDIIVFHLWHMSAFEKPHCHAIGNPGGKCRDIWINSKTKKKLNELMWE